MISNKARVDEARIWRKRYGAGMRQVGIIAAAGHYALDHNIDRLVEDHNRAKRLAEACAAIDLSFVNPKRVETNIVGLDLGKSKLSASEFAAEAKSQGVWIGALGPKFVRLVTHMDLDDDAIDKAIEVLQKLLKRSLVA
jgi:threonine aldolase